MAGDEADGEGNTHTHTHTSDMGHACQAYHRIDGDTKDESRNMDVIRTENLPVSPFVNVVDARD